MSTDLVLHEHAPDATLLEKRAELAAARGRLAECEAEFALLRSQLKTFEQRYMAEVGRLYAELDEVAAAIAERESLRDGSDDARRLAEEARARADETRSAADDAVAALESDAAREPSPNLKALFREVAKRIHPDLARDPVEQAYYTLLMARANQAYRSGDAQTLERMLADQVEINSAFAGESGRGEVLRVARQIRHAERDLAALEFELYALRNSELALLYEDAEAATREHRDLVAELGSRVRAEIDAAQQRLQAMEADVSDSVAVVANV